MGEMMRQQERVANNLANAGTVGYKRDRAFTEALQERIDDDGAPRSDRAATPFADLAQGALEQTGNPLDLALDGEGFFVLTDEASGSARYTRSGRFVLSADGTLRTPQGLAVAGEAGPIQVPRNATAIEVDRTGALRADGQEVGRLRVVTFADAGQLRRLDGAAFEAGAIEPEEAPAPTVLQGYVEESNVEPVREMTDMIAQFRLFESQQKTLQSTDQLLATITRDLGKF